MVNLNLLKAPEAVPSIIVPTVEKQSAEEGELTIDGIRFKYISDDDIKNATVGIYEDAELTEALGTGSWLTIANASNLAAGQLNCRIAANTTTENRTAYIGIKCGNVQTAIAVTQVAKGGSTDKYYVKVTKALEDWSGKYLIVYENRAMNGALSTIDAVSNYIEVEITEQGILSDETTNASLIEISKIQGTTGYILKTASNLYVYQTSNANGLTAKDDYNAAVTHPNTISIESNSAKISSSSAVLRYNAASNQERFRYYQSSSYTGQKAIQLYKLEE